MKTKGKYLIICCCIVFILLVVINIISENKSQTVDENQIKQLPLSNEYVDINFYYEQLTSDERNVYNKIIEHLDAYQGGEILLDKKISVNELSRIADAVRFNNHNNYFYFLFTLPFTSKNELVNWGTNQKKEDLEEKKISKLLLELYVGEEDTRLDRFEISDDMIVANYEKEKKIFSTISNDLMNQYESIQKETNEILDDIISKMPPNLTQEEAVEYFSNWIIENMQYTENYTSNIGYGEVRDEELQFSAYISSVTNQSAVCTGLSMVLSELCRKVGIESYVCLGTVSNGGSPLNHAWTAIKIGDTVYYKDPTKEVGANKVFPLKTEKELTSGNYILRFSRHFNYQKERNN